MNIKLIENYLNKFSLDPKRHQRFKCTQGKDPILMANKEYINAFREGPCLPFLILPGFQGVKLMVEIDCPVLRKKRPDIFKACGWTHCHQKLFEVVNLFYNILIRRILVLIIFKKLISFSGLR